MPLIFSTRFLTVKYPTIQLKNKYWKQEKSYKFRIRQQSRLIAEMLGMANWRGRNKWQKNGLHHKICKKTLGHRHPGWTSLGKGSPSLQEIQWFHLNILNSSLSRDVKDHSVLSSREHCLNFFLVGLKDIFK